VSSFLTAHQHILSYSVPFIHSVQPEGSAHCYFSKAQNAKKHLNEQVCRHLQAKIQTQNYTYLEIKHTCSSAGGYALW